MRIRTIAALALIAGAAGCATTPTQFPVQATRFHYDPVTTRGTIAVEALTAGAPQSLEYQDYAAAVEAELLRQGYTKPALAAKPDNLATVSYTRTTRPLPPRRAPLTIGIGGGGYSGGVGLGGGVSFPVGKGGARNAVQTELSVRIRRGPDAVWEGNAQTVTALDSPNAGSAAIATRLATALFTGFPGESGRTIEVK